MIEPQLLEVILITTLSLKCYIPVISVVIKSFSFTFKVPLKAALLQRPLVVVSPYSLAGRGLQKERLRPLVQGLRIGTPDLGVQV